VNLCAELPSPPPEQETPLYSKQGGRGNRHFHFPKFTEKFDIELVPRVCWLDKVVAFAHCCVLHISCIQGTVLDPVSCRPLSFSQFQPWMLSILTHTHLYTHGMVVNFKRSEGTIVLAKILGPSERGAEDRSITYERSGSMVMHDCAPIAHMSLPSPPRPVTSLTCQTVGEKAPYREEGAAEVGHFSTPQAPPPLDESDAVQLTSESSPQKRPRSSTATDNALVSGVLEKACQATV
jgi:hypothetical protein